MLKTLVGSFQSIMGSSLSQVSAIDTISSWDKRPAHELLFDSSRRDISQYMASVDKLQQLSDVKATSDVLFKAMARLRLEFHAVLSRQTDYHAGPASVTEYSSVADSTAYALRYEDFLPYEPPKQDVIVYLRHIAERMKSSGNLGEILKVYKTVRKGFLQSQLKRIRFEEMRISDSRRSVWDELKVKIELWNQASKICIKIFFEREKRLFEQIFHGIGPNYARDECFVGTIKDFALPILAFPESVAMSSQPFERMGTIFGLYDTFVSILPYVHALFGSEQGKGVRNGCAETLSKIENEVVRILHDLENTVLNEISSDLEDRGGVHRLTNYVIEQINIIVRFKNLLKNLIKTTPSLNFDKLVISDQDLGDYSTRSFLDLHVILILVVLQINLEKKSKFYQDPSLGHLFMMNNVRCVVQNVENHHELKDMIGYSYMKKLHENVSSSMNSYQESTCGMFLTCFEEDGLYTTQCFRPRLSKTALRRRLRSFDELFERIQSHHSLWTVPDSHLRDEIRLFMSKNLVPAYKKFLDKCRSVPEFKFNETTSIKYSADELQALVKELFVNSEADV